MNKLLIIPLLLVYLTMSVGVTIMLHTCGGETEAMVATTSTEDPCGCGEMMPEERCCTTELSIVKISDEQIGVPAQTGPFWMLMTTLAEDLSVPMPDVARSFPLVFTPDPAPPPDDLCVVHSVFRI
ncbi:MAG: hypothetical protein HUU02_11520 [Bacteroidetes bacterium]|nr:hypothetical protein [Bacteroidota bacterium]